MPKTLVEENDGEYSETSIYTSGEKPKILHTKVAGVSHKNDDGTSRQRIIKNHLSVGTRLYLKPDPENKYDPNAIEIWLDDIRQIGYVTTNMNEEVGRYLNADKHATVVVTAITGGTVDKPTTGVNIDILITNEPVDLNVQVERADGSGKKKTAPLVWIMVAVFVILATCFALSLLIGG